MGLPRDLPFVAFISIFLLIPTGELIVGALRHPNGAFTLSNIPRHLPLALPAAFEFSLELSALERCHRRHLRVPRGQCLLAPRRPRWLRPPTSPSPVWRQTSPGYHSPSPTVRRSARSEWSLSCLETPRHSHLSLLQPPGPDGGFDRVRLLPVPPHGPAHGPRYRGTAHRMAEAAANLGASTSSTGGTWVFPSSPRRCSG